MENAASVGTLGEHRSGLAFMYSSVSGMTLTFLAG